MRSANACIKPAREPPIMRTDLGRGGSIIAVAVVVVVDVELFCTDCVLDGTSIMF